MAAFLVRALDLPATTAEFFTDVGDSVFEADINRLAVAGITKGCNPPENDRYCPDDTVKRDQMASFLARALGLAPTVPPEPTLPDPLPPIPPPGPDPEVSTISDSVMESVVVATP